MKRRKLIKTAGILGATYPFIGGKAKAAATVATNKKLVVIPVELGYYGPYFRPKTDDPTSSPLMEHLRDFSNELTVFRDIAQPNIGHGHGNARKILNCGKKQSNGALTSIDQVAANSIEQNARYKHLNLGRTGFSWNANSREAFSLQDIGPDLIHERLFTRTANEAVLERKVKALDLMRNSLPTNPNESYLKAFRDLEKDVRTDMEWSKKPIPKVEISTHLNLSDAHDRGMINPIEQQLQLVRLALQHNRAQVVVASPPYIDKTSTIGVEGTYHQLGHRTSSKVEGYAERLLKLEKHLFNEYAKFISSLKENGLLEDTIVLIVGSFDDAGRHRRATLPTVLIGGGFNHQGVVDCLDGDKLKIEQAHLYLSILRQMGIKADDFAGDSASVDHLLM